MWNDGSFYSTTFNVSFLPFYYQDDNVHCYAVDGTSDDLDVPIKAVFSEPEYVAEHSLCSINSINWARILVQVSCDWWTRGQ